MNVLAKTFLLFCVNNLITFYVIFEDGFIQPNILSIQ